MCIIFHLAYYYFYDSFFNVPRKHSNKNISRHSSSSSSSFVYILKIERHKPHGKVGRWRREREACVRVCNEKKKYSHKINFLLWNIKHKECYCLCLCSAMDEWWCECWMVFLYCCGEVFLHFSLFYGKIDWQICFSFDLRWILCFVI